MLKAICIKKALKIGPIESKNSFLDSDICAKLNKLQNFRQDFVEDVEFIWHYCDKIILCRVITVAT